MDQEAKIDLNSLVEAIRARNIVEPVIFMLEMGKPLTGCAREAFRFGSPLLGLFGSSSYAPAIEQILESSDSLERFIRMLEQPQAQGAV